jgi:hypothetical protein
VISGRTSVLVESTAGQLNQTSAPDFARTRSDRPIAGALQS